MKRLLTTTLWVGALAAAIGLRGLRRAGCAAKERTLATGGIGSQPAGLRLDYA